jgi:hypothetical protein
MVRSCAPATHRRLPCVAWLIYTGLSLRYMLGAQANASRLRVLVNGCGFASPAWYALYLDLCWAMAGRLMTSLPSLRQCHREQLGGKEYRTEPDRSPPLCFLHIKWSLLCAELVLVNCKCRCSFSSL